MNIARSSFVAGSAAAVAALPLAAAAQTTPTLRLIVFAGTDLLPIWIADAKGLFAKEGIAVTLTQTPGSVYQFQHLSAGDFDVALTAIDNIIAYDEGQGQVPLPNPADFVAFMGGDNGFLYLYARPEITSYADLKGKTLAVDALTTGYAFVLKRMLEKNGLRDGDYKLEAVGGTPARYQKLTTSPDCAATLLNTPFDLQALAFGCKSLGDAMSVVGRYQALCPVASKAWLAKNGDLAVRYIRANLAALDWMYNPANRAEAIALLGSKLQMAANVAADLFALLVDPKLGMARKGQMDVPGIRTVLALRSAYGLPPKQLTDPLKYYDDRYYRQATAR